MTQDPNDKVRSLSDERKAQHITSGLDDLLRRGNFAKIAAAVIIVLGGGGTLYLLAEGKRETSLRDRIVAQHEELKQREYSRYASLQEQVAKLAASQAGAYAGDLRDARFNADALLKATGLYLRLPLKEAATREAVEKAARTQHSDAVAGCLSLNPMLYGKVLNDAVVLTPEFRKKIDEATTLTRLRAIEEDISVRLGRDLAKLAAHLRPDYLLLVLDEEPVHEMKPRRAALWDMRSGELLARVRTDQRGETMPVTFLAASLPYRHAKPDALTQNTADDCATAAALRDVVTAPAQVAAKPK